MQVGGEDPLRELFSCAVLASNGEVDGFPAFDPGAVQLHWNHRVLGPSLEQHCPYGVPLDAAPRLVVVLREERDDHLALLAVKAPELEVAILTHQLCLVPLVVEDAIPSQRFRQRLDDIPSTD